VLARFASMKKLTNGIYSGSLGDPELLGKEYQGYNWTASIEQYQFTNILFKDSKIMGFDWTKTRTARHLAFERCNISYSNFGFMKLKKLKLLECIAEEVNFSETDLSDGIFTKTDFTKSIFSGTNLTKADFRKAYNYGIDFNYNTLKKTRFSLPEAVSLLKSLDIVLD